MLQPIQYGDLVYVYHQPTRQYLSSVQFEIDPQGKLAAFPVLTKDPERAGLHMIESKQGQEGSVAVEHGFLLSSMTGLVQNRVYLGADQQQVLHNPGQEIRYMSPEMAVTWFAWVAHSSFEQDGVGQAKTHQIMMYGVPYALGNLDTAESRLRVLDQHLFNAWEDSDDIDDKFIFVPSTSLFVCQHGTNDCVEFQGSENLSLFLACDLDQQTCMNQFKEPIYWTEKECQSGCQRTVSGSVGNLPEIETGSTILPKASHTVPHFSNWLVVISFALLGVFIAWVLVQRILK